MSLVDLVFIVAALGVAGVDWWAVATGRHAVEEVAKPGVMILLMAAVLQLLIRGYGIGAESVFILMALAAGLVGDVLLLPRLGRFVGGLAAFLGGHLLYVAAFSVSGLRGAPVAVGVLFGGALLVAVGRPILRAVWRTRMAVPVGLYMVTIALMVAVGIGTGNRRFAIGVVLFAASDSLLGLDRFVTPRTDRRVLVHMLYHLAQAMIVAGLIPTTD